MAGIVILAHNLVPHFHDDDEGVAHFYHTGNSHDQDEDHGLSHVEAVDHAFVTDAQFHHDIVPLVAILTPLLYEALNNTQEAAKRDFIIPQDEGPPPLATVQRLSFRGPPVA